MGDAKKAKEQEKQKEVEDRMKAREAQLEKMKSIISQIQETPEQFKNKDKEKKGRKKKDKENESSASEDEQGEKKQKKKKARGKKKKMAEEMEDFVDDEDAAFVSRGANKKGKPDMQYKDSGKFKSKAVIESDS